MTLYAKQGRTFRPATEAEILSAYGSLMAARRKSKSGGPRRKLAGREESVRLDYYCLKGRKTPQGEILERLARYYEVSPRTIRRIVAETE